MGKAIHAVVVVLTARLSLPGRAELNKLGHCGCVWEVGAKLAGAMGIVIYTMGIHMQHKACKLTCQDM